MSDPGVTIRAATPADNQAVHDVFLAAIAEIDRRVGSADAVDDSDPAARAASWATWEDLFAHLAATADQSWLAEDASAGVVGYARSILRDGVRELTEFFVKPGWQRKGIGGELLRRAFSPEGARHRTIVATLETGALTRYLKTGLLARCLVMFVSAAPRANDVPSDLDMAPIDGDADRSELDRMDRRLLGHTRPVDHGYLLQDGRREGFLFRRDGRVVAYGYVGRRCGPIAVLDPADTTAVLARLESRAAGKAVESIGFWLPSVNREAVAYLLGRGFRIDPFVATFFSDDPQIALDRYLITSPPFFV